MAENDIHDLAAGLIESEPLMVIGRAVASGGQKVQDAWDTIQSHLSDLASKAKPAAESAINTVSSALTPTVQAQSTQPPAAASAPTRGTTWTAKEFAQQIKTQYPDYKDWSDEELVSAMLEKYPEYKNQVETPTDPNWRQAVGKGQVIFSNKVLAGARENLPTAGAVIGQTLGAPAGAGGTIGGAAVGAATGERIRQYLRAATGTEPLPDQIEAVKRMGEAGLWAGGSAAAGELLGAASNLIPSKASAGAKFQQVMGAARNVAVDVEPSGQAALRIQQLAERGGRLPKPVNDFLKYVTNPDKPQMTYEVARDFATNLGKLSVNERNQLTPVIQREVAIMTGELNKSVAAAAAKAGQGQTYSQAMTEYARAMRVKGMIDDFLSGARKSLPWMLGGGAAAAGAYGAKKVMDVVGGGE